VSGYSGNSKPDFDSIRQTNPYGQEYWSARDLMPLLGYEKWQRFEGAINRAIQACKQTGNNIADHFIGSDKTIQMPKTATRKIKDYNLSRFACYLVALNGEPSKREVAAAQAYFAVSTHENELHKLAEEQEERLALRIELAETTKDLTKTAQQAGVTSATFGLFHDAGYKGLYGGMGVADIKAHKGIPAKDDLPDRMGTLELSANRFKSELAANAIKKQGISTSAAAIQKHHETGEIVRNAIVQAGSPMPEDLPAEPSIKSLLNARKHKSKKAVPQIGQQSLFVGEDKENPSEK
jgi:DNA-damage-inducible protein D